MNCEHVMDAFFLVVGLIIAGVALVICVIPCCIGHLVEWLKNKEAG